MMQRRLFFICPTDCLESIINRTFGYNQCYYTSIGNSVVFDEDTTAQIERLIIKHNIQDIFFVLSNTNPIIRDALEDQHFHGIRGLDHIYTSISKQKNYSEILWQNNSALSTILSHHLNKKIKELRIQLGRLRLRQIRISGMIYNQNDNVFDDIYSDLIFKDYFSLN